METERDRKRNRDRENERSSKRLYPRRKQLFSKSNLIRDKPSLLLYTIDYIEETQINVRKKTKQKCDSRNKGIIGGHLGLCVS